MPSVAIVGASNDRRKFGNKSVRAHRQQGYDVYPVNLTESEIEGLKAYPSLSAIPAGRLDRISVYVPPRIGIGLLDEILKSQAREVWFNPGSTDAALVARAEEIGLPIIEACSIVDVGASPAQFPDR